jgi:hypothetical protein
MSPASDDRARATFGAAGRSRRNAAVREIQALTHELLDTFKADEQVLLPSSEAVAING